MIDSEAHATSPARVREHGVTIIEVMIALAIASIVAIPLLRLLQSSTSQEAELSSQLATAAELRFVSDRWADDVRSSTLAMGQRTRVVDAEHELVLRQPDGLALIRWHLDEKGIHRSTIDAASGKVIDDAVLLDAGQISTSSKASFVFFTRLAESIPPEKGIALLDACTHTLGLRLDQPDGDRLIELDVSMRLPPAASDQC